MNASSLRPHRRRHAVPHGRGFTLLELMVVLLILGLLTSVAAPRVMKHMNKAKLQSTRIQVDALGAAIDTFHLDVGRLPTNEEGLKSLIDRPADAEGWDGPYLKNPDSLFDPWRQPYRYRVPGRSGDFDVFSLGADGQENAAGNSADAVIQ